MNLIKLKKIVEQGESDAVEFKKSTGLLHAAFKTVCAFLNGSGGIILIGVTDHGKIIGQEISDATKREIAKEIADIEPSAQSQITVNYVKLENNKQVIVIKVDAGNHIPYVYDGRPFHRIQSTSPRMPQHRYEQLIIERGQLNHAWDELTAANTYDLHKLDADLILSVVNVAIKNKKLPASAVLEGSSKLLERFKLIKGGKIINAAAVLFGKGLFPEYPQCQIKLARFKGLDKREFLDNSQIYGNLFELLDQGELFIKRHLPTAAKIVPGQMRRIETPLVPFDAIREALLNALCHRDYSIRGSAVYVAIYDDRMELYSHGGLLPGVTLEKIKQGFSRPRNHRIADVLHKCGYIEAWGRGIQNIIELCKEADIPEPQFIVDEFEFKVVFNFPYNITNRDILSAEQKVVFKPSVRQQEILNILQSSGAISLKELADKLSQKPAERTLRDDLGKLKRQGLIKSLGHTKNTVWAIVDTKQAE